MSFRKAETPAVAAAKPGLSIAHTGSSGVVQFHRDMRSRRQHRRCRSQ
jgi:hypothetical protein